MDHTQKGDCGVDKMYKHLVIRFILKLSEHLFIKNNAQKNKYGLHEKVCIRY